MQFLNCCCMKDMLRLRAPKCNIAECCPLAISFIFFFPSLLFLSGSSLLTSSSIIAIILRLICIFRLSRRLFLMRLPLTHPQPFEIAIGQYGFLLLQESLQKRRQGTPQSATNRATMTGLLQTLPTAKCIAIISRSTENIVIS